MPSFRIPDPHADSPGRASRGAERFARRPDRSLGWAAMEARQAAALAAALGPAPPRDPPGEASPRLRPPPELSPLPAPRRRARSLRGLALDIGRGLLAWALALQLCYLAFAGILIAVYRRADPPVTTLMAYRKWSFGWKLAPPRPVRLAAVPRYVRRMLVAIEDGKFYEHRGLDFEAFARAREINERLGKPLYGGSTLTMQVARTLFLVPEKSYLRKWIEVLTALELEALLPKERILELYFGYAEWGKGVFGMEAAARKWYGRGVAALTGDEAARLIALLSSPIKYGPSTLGKSGILRERYAYLYGRYVQAEPPAAALGAGAEAGSSPSPAAALGAGAEAGGSPSPTAALGETDRPAAAGDAPPPSPEPGLDAEGAE